MKYLKWLSALYLAIVSVGGLYILGGWHCVVIIFGSIAATVAALAAALILSGAFD